jgi:hypothetical protein
MAELLKEEFKTISLRKPTEFHENTEKWFNMLTKKLRKQLKLFFKDQTDILE